jgi:hypothetical protein
LISSSIVLLLIIFTMAHELPLLPVKIILIKNHNPWIWQIVNSKSLWIQISWSWGRPGKLSFFFFRTKLLIYRLQHLNNGRSIIFLKPSLLIVTAVAPVPQRAFHLHRVLWCATKVVSPICFGKIDMIQLFLQSPYW